MCAYSTSAAVSPSKEFVVGINIRGNAELFGIESKQFLQVLHEGNHPYKPLVAAIFYGHSSLALAFADSADLHVIPRLNITGEQTSDHIILLRRDNRPYPSDPVKFYVGACFRGLMLADIMSRTRHLYMVKATSSLLSLVANQAQT